MRNWTATATADLGLPAPTEPAVSSNGSPGQENAGLPGKRVTGAVTARVAEDAGFEPARVLTPNTISNRAH